MKNIAILGAGIGGMAAAYDLARAGHNITIFESAEQTGGLASGFTAPGWNWSVEKFYHHWFQSDAHMLGLINELGLSHNLRFPRPTTVMYHNGRFYPFDSIPAALLYPGLGWGIHKIRFGLVALYLRLTNRWQPLEQHTTHNWMRRYAGDLAYERMWKPMLEGKFGKYYQDVNMAWMWARLKTRTPRLGTYEGGFQAFCDTFADKLRAQGVTLHLNTPVTQISPVPVGNGLSLQVRGETQRFDSALVTTAPAALAKLAPALPPDYLQGLLNLKHLGAVVMVLALKHPLSPEGYYWYNMPKSAGFPFLALVEHTNFVSPENFGGDHIIYLGDYLEPDHEYFRLTPDELLQRYLPALSRINPAFQPDWVKAKWLFRTAYAQPVPLTNHSRNIPTIRTPIDGLYFASMSQVYPWDRGTNFAVEIGRRAARAMLDG